MCQYVTPIFSGPGVALRIKKAVSENIKPLFKNQNTWKRTNVSITMLNIQEVEELKILVVFNINYLSIIYERQVILPVQLIEPDLYFQNILYLGFPFPVCIYRNREAYF